MKKKVVVEQSLAKISGEVFEMTASAGKFKTRELAGRVGLALLRAENVASETLTRLVGHSSELGAAEEQTTGVDEAIDDALTAARAAASGTQVVWALSDSLRYTIVFEEETYADSVRATRRQIQEEGLKVIRCVLTQNISSIALCRLLALQFKKLLES